MQKKSYSSPLLELIELQLTDTILASTQVPTIMPTEEYVLPVFGRRPSPKDELEGDDLFE